MSTTYTIDVRRDHEQWTADVRDMPAAHTFARNLTLLDKYIREAIAVVEDLPEGAEPGLDLEYCYHGVAQAIVDADEIGRRRRHAAKELAEANQAAQEAIPVLTAAGCSVRDTAQLLGVSPGRVSQLSAA